MQSKRIKKIFLIFTPIFLLIFIAFGVMVAQASAFTKIDPTKYPWHEATQNKEAPISGFVSSFYTFALGAVGVAALGALIYGGILWTVSGAVSTQQEAKEWISGAIWGLVLLLAAYLILNTINPALVNLTEPAVEPVGVVEPVGSESTSQYSEQIFQGNIQQ